MMWKIVRASEASVLYIYIYIYIDEYRNGHMIFFWNSFVKFMCLSFLLLTYLRMIQLWLTFGMTKVCSMLNYCVHVFTGLWLWDDMRYIGSFWFFCRWRQPQVQKGKYYSLEFKFKMFMAPLYVLSPLV